MKIGMIFECGPQGADQAVCEYLAKRLNPELEIESRTLDNKPNLLSECGEVAALLLASGCDYVLIIWDLYPPWREKKQRPCRQEDCTRILASLEDAKVNLDRVHLVCIEEELEAWLLADDRPLKGFLASLIRPHPLKTKIKAEKKPERVKNPKGKLTQIFQETTGRKYVDMIDAIKIVHRVQDFQKLRNSVTFVRFCRKATGIEL